MHHQKTPFTETNYWDKFLRQIEIMDYRREIIKKLLMKGYDCILCDETHDLGEIYDEYTLFFLAIWTVYLIFPKVWGWSFGLVFFFLIRQYWTGITLPNIWDGKPRLEMKSKEILIPLCHQVESMHTYTHTKKEQLF